MGKEIMDLAPALVWKHFYNLTQIPRPSYYETEAIKYIEQFANDLGLENIIDEVGNIIVKKPATAGRENASGVILQSHIDMVPQKNSDKVHDFQKDPIETIIDGEWVRANKTTLGADNGMGCAAMLAVLESSDIQHGKIEALFTINEESGMEGAFGLKAGVLEGSILINLDSEDEGELFVGCAGGIDVAAKTNYAEVASVAGKAFNFTIAGLSGGHSGLDINLGRGNAVKIIGRFLWSALANFPIQIASVNGGDLRNAIPREGHSVIVVSPEHENEFKNFFENFKTNIINEYKSSDPGIGLELKAADMPSKVMSEEEAKRLSGMLATAHSGTVRMSVEMEGIVESSLNLSVTNFENGKAEMYYLVRSSVDSAKFAIAEQVTAMHELMGCEVEASGDYPGWKPNTDSYIMKVMTNVYNDLYGRTPNLLAIHAGLECGIIGANYPGLDIISFGPTIRHPHSPDEKVEISTVEKFWNFLKHTLEKI
jgi:dipeptidase D